MKILSHLINSKFIISIQIQGHSAVVLLSITVNLKQNAWDHFKENAIFYIRNCFFVHCGDDWKFFFIILISRKKPTPTKAEEQGAKPNNFYSNCHAQ
jgi:hypothetical protein